MARFTQQPFEFYQESPSTLESKPTFCEEDEMSVLDNKILDSIQMWPAYPILDGRRMINIQMLFPTEDQSGVTLHISNNNNNNINHMLHRRCILRPLGKIRMYLHPYPCTTRAINSCG